MRLESFQSCRSNDGWIPILVESGSVQGLDYTVMVCPWDSPSESICECPGYIFQGHCKHQIIAYNSLCRWNEMTGPEEQTKEQRKNKVCPRCGGLTKYELEVVEDEDA